MSSHISQFLHADELDAVRRPLERASLLPPRCYDDAGIFALEVEKVFMRNWVALAHQSELPAPGDYLTRSFFGEPVLLARDLHGELFAASNVCRHRARQVAEGRGNCLERGGYQCPYHAWFYDTAGQLQRAPYMDRTAQFDTSEWRLPRLRLEAWNGFLFVNFDPNAQPLTPQLATLHQALEPFHIEQMRCVEFTQYEAPWNWKATIENFSEAYHQPPIHPQTFEPWCPARICRYENVDGPYGLFSMPTASAQPLPSPFPAMPGLPEDYYREALVVNIMPMFHLLVDAAAIAFLDWDIRGPRDHRIIWKLLVPRSSYELPDFEQRKASFLEAMMPVWREDIYACKGVAAGVRSRYARPGRLSWMERTVHQFQNWVVDQYEAT